MNPTQKYHVKVTGLTLGRGSQERGNHKSSKSGSWLTPLADAWGRALLCILRTQGDVLDSLPFCLFPLPGPRTRAECGGSETWCQSQVNTSIVSWPKRAPYLPDCCYSFAVKQPSSPALPRHVTCYSSKHNSTILVCTLQGLEGVAATYMCITESRNGWGCSVQQYCVFLS